MTDRGPGSSPRRCRPCPTPWRGTAGGAGSCRHPSAARTRSSCPTEFPFNEDKRHLHSRLKGVGAIKYQTTKILALKFCLLPKKYDDSLPNNVIVQLKVVTG